MRKRLVVCIWMNTGLRVLCCLKLFSSMDDWSLESLSFFLHPLLLLLSESVLFSLGYSWILSKLILSTFSWWWWWRFTLMASSPFGQSSNARSRHTTALFSFCLFFFGTCPDPNPSPSPKHSPAMHSSLLSSIRERKKEREKRLNCCIVKWESWVLWKRWI